MDESFLVEQLNRIRAMAAQMAQARESVEQLSSEISRARQSMRHNPLYEVRDLRIDQPYDPLDAPPRHSARRRSSARRRRE